MMEDRKLDGRICPRCENEEICHGDNYCKICGLPLAKDGADTNVGTKEGVK